MKLRGIFDEKYKWVKTQKRRNRTCKICKEKHDYYRTFFKFHACGHLVHRGCYETYNSNKCPKCKTQIYDEAPKRFYQGYAQLDG